MKTTANWGKVRKERTASMAQVDYNEYSMAAERD
jgi:hypothetical protein